MTDLVQRLRQHGDDLAAQDDPQPCHEAADKIERLRAALEEIVNPLKFIRERAEANGDHLSDRAYSIANDLNYVQQIARTALSK